ncbi:hypothetical protein FraQA3DRAFT_5456 [Frankia sp. QA3]|nr:hypothetical protein FraQA3DRAFT_5456 [Frankia sp. QA3]
MGAHVTWVRSGAARFLALGPAPIPAAARVADHGPTAHVLSASGPLGTPNLSWSPRDHAIPSGAADAQPCRPPCSPRSPPLPFPGIPLSPSPFHPSPERRPSPRYRLRRPARRRPCWIPVAAAALLQLAGAARCPSPGPHCPSLFECRIVPRSRDGFSARNRAWASARSGRYLTGKTGAGPAGGSGAVRRRWSTRGPRRMGRNGIRPVIDHHGRAAAGAASCGRLRGGEPIISGEGAAGGLLEKGLWGCGADCCRGSGEVSREWRGVAGVARCRGDGEVSRGWRGVAGVTRRIARVTGLHGWGWVDLGGRGGCDAWERRWVLADALGRVLPRGVMIGAECHRKGHGSHPRRQNVSRS